MSDTPTNATLFGRIVGNAVSLGRGVTEQSRENICREIVDDVKEIESRFAQLERELAEYKQAFDQSTAALAIEVEEVERLRTKPEPLPAPTHDGWWWWGKKGTEPWKPVFVSYGTYIVKTEEKTVSIKFSKIDKWLPNPAPEA